MADNPYHVQLCDFGVDRITCFYPGSSSTPIYQAREVWVNNKSADKCSDVWSGCLIGVEWFVGKKLLWKLDPSESTDMETKAFQQSEIMKESKKLPTEHVLGHIPEEVQTTLDKGLNYKVKERPKASKIQEELLKCLCKTYFYFFIKVPCIVFIK